MSSAELLENADSLGHHFEVLAKPTEPHQLLRVLAGGKSTAHGTASGIHRVK